MRERGERTRLERETEEKRETGRGKGAETTESGSLGGVGHPCQRSAKKCRGRRADRWREERKERGSEEESRGHVYGLYWPLLIFFFSRVVKTQFYSSFIWAKSLKYPY